MHPAALPTTELLKQTTERRLRRGGPGGQHRNKVETAVALHHEPTGVSAEANEKRSQQKNREEAIHRLRMNLALEIRDPAAETPSELWKSRVRGGRIAVNVQHEDMPALLAEALDTLASHEYDMKQAAEQLGVSTLATGEVFQTRTAGARAGERHSAASRPTAIAVDLMRRQPVQRLSEAVDP